MGAETNMNEVEGVCSGEVEYGIVGCKAKMSLGGG